jgi:cysteine dioxygenase
LDLLHHCRALEGGGTRPVYELVHLLSRPIQAEELPSLLREDPARPYGRNVILAGVDAEVMVARWTRGTPCAPHDHGGSVGAVRVLQGEAIHRVWSLEGGSLRCRLEERVTPGKVLACGPGLIHSMEDGGAEEPLATLHVYSGAIPFMTVYDLAKERTLRVDPCCGAWIPDTSLIQATVAGFVPRAHLETAQA